MAINKNFVVKHGLEVSTDLILADATKNKVGIASTAPRTELDVRGGIAATDISISGVGTIVTLQSTTGTITNLISTNANVGLATVEVVKATHVYTTGITTTTDLDVVGVASIAVGIVTSISGTFLNYSGIATIGNLNSTNLNVSGFSTFNAYADFNGGVIADDLNVTGIATIATVDINAGDIEVTSVRTGNFYASGISTIASLSVTGSTFDTLTVNNFSTLNGVTTVTNADITNLDVSGVSTLGTVKVSSGIITAVSGIVTYYGDGAYLQNISAGIGIGTTGGLVGYGVTFINFYGAGVSTTLYNSSVGVATIFFEGGGSGTIGIGTLFPTSPAPGNGDLFFNANYGRLFVYYDEIVLGVGATAYWIDAAPFNVGIITALTNVSFYPGSATSPSVYIIGDNQTGFFSPSSKNITFVSAGSSVLNINPGGINVTGVITASSFSGNASSATYATSSGIATYATSSGIATYATSSGIATYATTSGVSTSVIGGIGSITSLTVSGISTLGNIQISSGIITTTANSYELYKPVLYNYSEKVNIIGNTGSGCTINLANGAYVTATLDQSTTFTFTTGITTGAIGFALQLTNGTGGPYSITWPVSVKWPNNATPTRTTADSKTDVWVFNSTDNGTTWYGNLALYNFS